MYTNTYGYICIYVFILYMCMYTNALKVSTLNQMTAFTQMYLNIKIYICIYTYMYAYIYTYIYLHLYVYMYM